MSVEKITIQKPKITMQEKLTISFPKSSCCYCMKPTSENITVDAGRIVLELPYCEQHAPMASELLNPQNKGLPTSSSGLIWSIGSGVVGGIIGVITWPFFKGFGIASLLWPVALAIFAYVIASQIVKEKAVDKKSDELQIPKQDLKLVRDIEAQVQSNWLSMPPIKKCLGVGVALKADKKNSVLEVEFCSEEYAKLFEAEQSNN